MELRHLQYFIAVAEELHFGRAAKRVHIAQPPLSQQIRQLEEELGAPLFYRTKRRVELTPAGVALLPQAKDLVARAQLFPEVVRLSARGEVGTLRIGYVEEAVHFVFPYFLNAFQSRYPNVKVQLTEMHSRDQVDSLETGKIDFGFGYSQNEVAALEKMPVLKSRILLALPETHPLANQKTVDLSKCKTQKFIFPVRASSPQLYDFLLSICRANDLVPEISYTAEHIYTVMGLVRCGFGVTLFPDFLHTDEWAGVAFRPLRGKSFYLEMLAQWNSRYVECAVNQNFLQMLREALPNIT